MSAPGTSGTRRTRRAVSRLGTLARRRFGVGASRAAPGEGMLVSVVVPVFNDERFVEAALGSVLSQSYRNLELIVVDDASTDGSTSIVTTLALRDSRVSLLRHARNLGLPSARNTGLVEARGDLVAFLDSDDLLLPESLWDRVVAFEPCRGDAAVAGSYSRIHSMPENGGGLTQRLLPLAGGSDPVVTFLTRDGECPFAVHAPLVRREVLLALGGFDATMTAGCEDWDLWQRMLRRGYVFVPSQSIGGAYRARPGSMRLAAPLAHTEAALELLRRAYAPATIAPVSETSVLASRHAPSLPVRAWPCAMERPLPDYRRDRLAAARLIRAAALSMLNGNSTDGERCFGLLPNGTASWLRHEMDIAGDVRAAVRTGLGLGAIDEARTHEIVTVILDRLGAAQVARD